MKKLFISQPMRGKTDEEIEVIESFFESAPANATPLWYLGESLKLLGTADFAVFAPRLAGLSRMPH